MANFLGSVALPDGTTDEGELEWIDRFEWKPVAQTRQRTLAGTLIVFEMPLSGGRPITLQAAEDGGWLNQTTVDALLSLVQAGGIYPLSFDGFSANVVFRIADGPLQLQPILSKWDRWFGIIRLMEI